MNTQIMEEQRQYNPSSWTEEPKAESHSEEGRKEETTAAHTYLPFARDITLTGPAALQQAAEAVEYAARHGTSIHEVAFENGTLSPKKTISHNSNEVTKPSVSPPPTEEPKSPQTQTTPIPEVGASRKRKLCQFPGCTKVVKSQNHCQAHGAKAKRCSVEGCDKQAQTTHEGMCKRHWRIKNFPENSTNNNNETDSDQIKSVYENVLPQSIAFRPMAAAKAQEKSISDLYPTAVPSDPLDPAPAPEGAIVMPLVAFLQDNASKPFGWHRNEEREARGLGPIASFSDELEEWERQLAVVEILLLGGGTPYASFKNLAHGWGREKGFHSALIQTVCQERGEIIRKRKMEFEAASAEKRPAIETHNIDPNPEQEPQQEQEQQPTQQEEPATDPSAAEMSPNGMNGN